MKQIKISLREFIDSYKESLGVEGAEHLLRQTLSCTGMDNQNDFTKEEALKICRRLKQRAGFIGVMGGIIQSRIIIR